MTALLTLKLCNSFLFVGGKPFRGVRAGESLGEQFPFERQTFVLTALQPALDRALDEAYGLARLVWRHKLPRVIENLREEVVGLENILYKTIFLRFLECDQAAGCRQLDRASLTDQPRQ